MPRGAALPDLWAHEPTDLRHPGTDGVELCLDRVQVHLRTGHAARTPSTRSNRSSAWRTQRQRRMRYLGSRRFEQRRDETDEWCYSLHERRIRSNIGALSSAGSLIVTGKALADAD